MDYAYFDCSYVNIAGAMQIHQSGHDIGKLTELGLASLENALITSIECNDKNLLTAIEILKTYEPSITNAGPGLNGLTELEHDIIAAWNQLFDEHIRAHAQPRSVNNAMLRVDVDSSAWLDEIVRYRKKDILTQLQQKFGKQAIRTIHYSQHDLPSSEVRLSFTIPKPLIELSATPQKPRSVNSSAQSLIRAALTTASAPRRVLVSFHQEGSSPAPEFLKEPPGASIGDVPSASGLDDFEMFAEDDFSCQRCGRQTPNVVLCQGETKSFANTKRPNVTICLECDQTIRAPNLPIQGLMSNDEKVAWGKEQLEKFTTVQKLSEHWSALMPSHALTGGQRRLICELILQFKFEEIALSMRKAVDRYVETIDGIPTEGSGSRALRRVSGICHNRRNEQ